MPQYRNGVPQGPTWFDWLPQKVQCVLLLLITLPATGGFFWGGMHCIHTGKAVVVKNEHIDASELFFASLVFLFVSGCILAVLMGWTKSNTPHISETHHRKP